MEVAVSEVADSVLGIANTVDAGALLGGVVCLLLLLQLGMIVRKVK